MYQMLIPIHVLNAHQQLLIAIFVLQLLLAILVRLDILVHYAILVIQQVFTHQIRILLLVLVVYLIALPVLLQTLALHALHHMLLITQIHVQHVYLLITTPIESAIFVAPLLLIAMPAQTLLPAHHATLVILVTFAMLVILTQDIMHYQLVQPYANDVILKLLIAQLATILLLLV